MNKSKLTSLCPTISERTGLSFNAVMTYYFMENILRRLAHSEIGRHLVFKGGFLLSNVVGIRARSTVDIDLHLHQMTLAREQVLPALSRALEGTDEDGTWYAIQSVQAIKEEDRYSGLRVSVVCHMQNIRLVIPLDIAAGDVLTPHAIAYQYASVFGPDIITIRAYPLETMLAEKLHTIFARGFLNSRSKDYYDLHILYQLKRQDISPQTLLAACRRTFQNRQSIFSLSDIRDMLSTLAQDTAFLQRWQTYQKKNTYVGHVSFQDTIHSTLALLDMMDGRHSDDAE